MGRRRTRTRVRYRIPPEVSALQRTIVNELQALRPLAESAVPRIQGAIQQFIEQYQDWLARAPLYFDEAQRRLTEIVEEPIRQRLTDQYEEARRRTKELSQEVLQDAIRNTIRRLALQGLISQTAGTQAMAEQFRQYEYEPLQRLIEVEAEAKRKLQEQMLRERANIEATRLNFQLSLPNIYREIMQAQQQYALTPFELRRALLGTLTSSAGVVQQLSPASVTYTTRGGLHPLLGTALSIIGSLGASRLIGRQFPLRLKGRRRK
ncbi:TPA: apolipoprotein [Aquificae Conch Spring virus]|nr:TPA: apolipoprotein [Aquificae Conch Spring virus]